MPDEPQDHLRNEEAEVIRKEEVVDIYAALLDKIWQRAITILGLVTIRAIMEHAIRMTAQDYALIGELDVDENGLNSSELRARVGERERKVIRKGFEELILNLFDLLAKLTSETIVTKLFADELPPGRPGTRDQPDQEG
jgi:hypothetical protein